MISVLEGTLIEKRPSDVVLDVGGVGYRAAVPLSTYRGLPDTGTRTRLLTHLIVRDDALELYGFLTSAEREIFRALIGVTGIGPKLGLAALSGLSPDVFHRAVIDENLGLLTSVSGIGKKTAQRMIVELKEKFSGMDVSSIGGGEGAGREEAGDAVAALVQLGLTRASAREAVLRVRREAGCDLPIEEVIKRALRKSG
ncbi:MAG: Holliday junction branch migration protein RuvA [Candidatus Eisenbacteria bacterium]|nr:Holliday junction branch migration protein RuvA [Candidatus Eisenbacteria bacterium]